MLTCDRSCRLRVSCHAAPRHRAPGHPAPDSAASAGPASRRPSALSPLRYGIFRAIWLANLFSNLGTWAQSVGAAWLMTSLAPSPDMVALVQAATSAPILLFSLAAGAIADIWDRRTVMLCAQGTMLLAAATLAALAGFGLVTPWVLLGLTFVLGMGSALNGPAWQASVAEQVPREEVPAAVTLNSVNFNIARSVGPALGGLIVGAAGAEAAFLFNAVSYVALILVLFGWQRPAVVRRLPRERMAGAMVAGLRYVRHSTVIRIVLARTATFGIGAGAVWALLPLVARHDLGGGPLTYGLLLGALGVGAVLGAAGIGRLRRRLSNDLLVGGATAVFALTSIALAFAGALIPLLLALVAGGAGWMTVLSSLYITVQMQVPDWVKGRAMAVFQMSMFGGLALGSWLWGLVATAYGVPAALTGAGGLMLASLLVFQRFRLPPLGAADLRPARTWPEPQVALEVDAASGPVLVTVAYRVAPERAEGFVLAMQGLRRLRRRDGARRWGLFRDVADPERWVEVFSLSTWLEHLHQHDRVTVADREVEERVKAFHIGPDRPVVTHLVLQHPSAVLAPPVAYQPEP